MELPDSVKGIGEQLGQGGDIVPPPELFEAHDVFAAETNQIFIRPWLAVDHASRLGADGDFVKADAGPRSIVVVRESEQCIHALRNICLHAGYRVCEEDSGRVDRLYCQYHGWTYALDGRLTEPLLQPNMTDRSRFRLPRYAMRIERGLIFVDPSALAPEPPEAGPLDLGALPQDLADRPVGRRQRHKLRCNWKPLRRFLWANPELALGREDCDAAVEFGPLSLVALRNGEAALIRLTPRYPGQTEVDVLHIGEHGARGGNGSATPLAAALEDTESIAAQPLDRAFYDWYWPLMAPAV